MYNFGDIIFFKSLKNSTEKLPIRLKIVKSSKQVMANLHLKYLARYLEKKQKKLGPKLKTMDIWVRRVHTFTYLDMNKFEKYFFYL